MDAMRADMGGAACVMASIYTAARLKLPINLKGIFPWFLAGLMSYDFRKGPDIKCPIENLQDFWPVQRICQVEKRQNQGML